MSTPCLELRIRFANGEILNRYLYLAGTKNLDEALKEKLGREIINERLLYHLSEEEKKRGGLK